jgi:hypothetical protein
VMRTRCRYVLANTSEMNRGGRGGLAARLQMAGLLGCDLVEMPADFIKNKTEIRLTGLEMGSFLDQSAISLLYGADPVPASCQIVLHTEPELSLPCLLCWHDRAWVDAFVRMQIALIRHLRVPPAVIEIHPGDRHNTIKDIIGGALRLIEEVGNAFGRAPLVLLENRTRQVVSTGQDLLEFWRSVARGGGLSEQIGVVLDIQQLFTQTGGNAGNVAGFLAGLRMIPDEALRGFHIHRNHRNPSLNDAIPWREVFGRIRQLKNDFLVNPEIHHSNAIAAALSSVVALCKHRRIQPQIRRDERVAIVTAGCRLRRLPQRR